MSQVLTWLSSNEKNKEKKNDKKKYSRKTQKAERDKYRIVVFSQSMANKQEKGKKKSSTGNKADSADWISSKPF